MHKVLNISNGSCAINIMAEAEIPGEFLAWNDVLHDGPVPEYLSLEELSKVRSQFIFEQGWGTLESIINSFTKRDEVLKTYFNYDKVILWFEHDLYDQLQILQILDWFFHQSITTTELSIICTEQYLGMLNAKEMKGLLIHETPITDRHLKLSQLAWTAFRSSTPEKWVALLHKDTSVLPFLQAAIIRLLEEYPNFINGLSRTAQQALKIISNGEKRPGMIFSLYQETEDRRYLGDSSFWLILHQLLQAEPPLLKLTGGKKLTLPASPEQELNITQVGREVLAGEINWLNIVELDQWIGGVNLNSSNIWCWDQDTGMIIKKFYKQGSN